ncbi:MAG: 3-oxoacyl-ACP synthase III family protein [Oligoflexales bacterium]
MRICSEVIGIGSYLPSKVVGNQELEEVLDTSDEWIKKRCGIHTRHWADPKETTSDLALKASHKAIEQAQIDPASIDMIIVATVTPDHEFPGTACFLQAKLELPGIPAIDVRQQCSGFIYAMSQADLYLKSGSYKNVLLVCAELHSKCLDLSPRGRGVSILFGDGAAAMVLQAKENRNKDDSQVYSTSIHSDGSFAKMLWCPAPGNGMPCSTRIDAGMLEEGLQFPHMNGRAIFTHAVRHMSKSLNDCLADNQVELDDVDLLFFHQANLRICEAVEKQLEVKPGRVYNTIQEYGNTTAATIPLGIEHAVRNGVLKKGMLIATVAFGSGFTWGSSLIRW